MYAILDIETTGGKYNEEGITEIAIYRFNGHEVTDQFISLVNPEKEIQPFVVKLTGISNKMLVTAPKFHEVAKRIVEITEDCILVAHNAQFDYRILQTEFRRLGYDYQRRSLCTVELSQTLMPEQPSFSLGKLVRSLGIPVSDRHRANGDAVATLKLFKILLNKDTHKEILKSAVRTASTGILSQRLLDMVEEMPASTGLYYMHDSKGEVIFIERSTNLKKSVNKRFTSASKRSRNLQKAVRAVTYEETGTELIAALKEEEELRINKPRYNRRKKAKPFNYVLRAGTTEQGYQSLEIVPYQGQNSYITSFSTYPEAHTFLSGLCKTYALCLKVSGLSQAKQHCSAYDEKACHGACMQEEDPKLYNARMQEAIQSFSIANRDMIITGKGREIDEKSALLIKKGKISGYGFVNLNHQLHSPEVLQSLVSTLTANKQSRHLVERYLRRHKNIQTISFDT